MFSGSFRDANAKSFSRARSKLASANNRESPLVLQTGHGREIAGAGSAPPETPSMGTAPEVSGGEGLADMVLESVLAAIWELDRSGIGTAGDDCISQAVVAPVRKQ